MLSGLDEYISDVIPDLILNDAQKELKKQLITEVYKNPYHFDKTCLKYFEEIEKLDENYKKKKETFNKMQKYKNPIKIPEIAEKDVIFDPNSKETLFGCKIETSDKKNYKIIATEDIQKGKIIYFGSPKAMMLTREKSWRIPIFEGHISKYCALDKKVLDKQKDQNKEQEKQDDKKYMLMSVLQSLEPRPETEQDILEEFSDVTLVFKLSKNVFHSENACCLYEKASFFNHSCVANAGIFDPTKNSSDLTIVALENIKQDEEITINYLLEPIEQIAERKKRLWNEYRFECWCPACNVIGCMQPLDLFFIENKDNQRMIKSMDMVQKCMWCQMPGFNKCTQCRKARYCSRECQIAHWRQSHKKYCLEWK